MALISDHRIAGSKHGAVGIGSAQDVVKSSALALLILFASAALYSAMPSARVTTDVQNWLIVQHDRFGAVGQPQNVMLQMDRVGGDPVTLRLDDAFSQHYVLERTQPVASTVSQAGGGTLLTFVPPQNSDVFDLALTVKPITWGRQVLTMNASIAQRITVQASITQFVIP